MFTLQKITGKPPPHIELVGEEKWGNIDLTDGIPLNTRVAVRGLSSPLTLTIKYDKFFFKGFSKMKNFEEVNLTIYGSFKHRRPDSMIHDVIYRGKPKELVFKCSTP